MTLQERLKASAKELVRLLEEDIANIERLRDEARETAAAYTDKDKSVPRVVKLALEEMGIKPVEMKLDNGKAFERREFKPWNYDDYCDARIMLATIRQIEKLKERVAILEGTAAAESDQERSADQQTGDTPEGGKLPSNDTEATERSDRHFQQQHQGYQPASGHGRRSENQSSTEEPSSGFVERLIRESIQVIPLELVRIDRPAVVLVRDPDTGEENRYMMTLSPIARS